jgi:hypothetical protein
MMSGHQRIRPFLGSRDFSLSRRFYQAVGFRELEVSKDMVAFNGGPVWFYLQDYYVKDWVENTMVFLEVADLDRRHRDLTALNLPDDFPGVRISAIQDNDWGREFFMHDPAGNLWHIGTFNP